MQPISELVSEGKALPLPQLVMLSMDLMAEALSALQRLGPHNVEACKLSQDALMFGMLLGYSYSQRESNIIGVSHPSYQGLCQHPDCGGHFCRGNR